MEDRVSDLLERWNEFPASTDLAKGIGTESPERSEDLFYDMCKQDVEFF